jgi:hypothetical protein
MRRVLALAALTTAIIATAGCGTSNNNAGGSTPTNSSAPAGNNTTEVCTAIESSTRDALNKMAPELAKAIQASTNKDTAAATAAVRAVMPIVQAWAGALRTETGKATDAELKGALTMMVAEFDKMIPQMATANGIDGLPDMETTDFVNSSKTIEKVCGFKFDEIAPS